MHVATTRRHYKGKVYESTLLRRSSRKDGKVRNETVGNLSHLPPHVIEGIRAMLAGKALVDLDHELEIERSLPHGHVAAVLGVLRALDVERVIGRERCRERDLVVAMIVQRVVGPGSKLSATRRFGVSTLAQELDLGEVKEAELLAAMDWLLGRQERIEKTLAHRHLSRDGFVLYDLSSSYVEGRCCPLAKLGYSRDGRKGTQQVNYGLICSPQGRPVAVHAFDGSTTDSKTLPDAVQSVTERFGVKNVVLVGDRGMITQAHAQTLKDQGVGNHGLGQRGGQPPGVLPDRADQHDRARRWKRKALPEHVLEVVVADVDRARHVPDPVRHAPAGVDAQDRRFGAERGQLADGNLGGGRSSAGRPGGAQGPVRRARAARTARDAAAGRRTDTARAGHRR